MGRGGAQRVTPGTGVNREVHGTIPGGYGNALSTLFGNNFPRWTVQLNLSYPLGVSSQEASVARARVQLNQVQAQTKIEVKGTASVFEATLLVELRDGLGSVCKTEPVTAHAGEPETGP